MHKQVFASAKHVFCKLYLLKVAPAHTQAAFKPTPAIGLTGMSPTAASDLKPEITSVQLSNPSVIEVYDTAARSGI